jgi:2-methylcitrate dehydratase PrpD
MDMTHDSDVEVSAGNSGATLTRRSLLQRAGCFVAAMAFPHQAGVAAEAISPIMAKLSTYMSEARDRALPDEVVEMAKHHILDTLAAMVSGSELPGGRAAIRFARAYGGEKVATVVASNVLCGPIEAALANGELGHSDETDDGSIVNSHPGTAVVPAALALGEQFGIEGMQFVRAVVLGYDIGPRVAIALRGPSLEARQAHGIAGVLSAAAAAGCAASLNIQQMRWLLEYAADQSSTVQPPILRDTEHIEKAFVVGGMPARNGVTAALVVKSGWTGVDDMLSGPGNFFLAYASQGDPAGLVEKLGERYEVTRSRIKKWTVGGPNLAPLDGLDILMKRHPFEAEQVQKVIVRLSPLDASIVNNRDMPDICLQHLYAVMLIDKTVSFSSLHDKPRMQDPAILRQRAKVQLVPDQELERPLGKRVAIVEVVLADGTHFSERVDAVRGTIGNPMTRDEVVAKARDLMTPVLGQATSTNLIERLLGLELVKDIRELRPLLQRT